MSDRVFRVLSVNYGFSSRVKYTISDHDRGVSTTYERGGVLGRCRVVYRMQEVSCDVLTGTVIMLLLGIVIQIVSSHHKPGYRRCIRVFTCHVTGTIHRYIYSGFTEVCGVTVSGLSVVVCCICHHTCLSRLWFYLSYDKLQASHWLQSVHS